MTIPLWSLPIASFLPYLWFGIASNLRKQEFGELDNRHPRLQEAKQTDRGARAMGASSNAFEALMLYVPAVLVAHVQAADSKLATLLAVVFLVSRVLHGVAYIGDKPSLRSACFGIGALCTFALYFVGAHII
jgi:uncharacterized MAPEG superfamily protein